MAAYNLTSSFESNVSGTHLQNYCIALQPICDGDLKHVADELLYRDSANASSASLTDAQAVEATARVCNIAFYEIGASQLVGDRKLYVNAPRDWLLRPELLPPEPARVVIEVLETVVGDEEVLASLRKIREMGFQVALDDFVLTDATRPLLDVAHIIKIDALEAIDLVAIELYRARGLTLLAEKVEDMEAFERFKSLGFSLFQGYFYARAQVKDVPSGQRSNNRAALLHLLAELQRGEPRIRAIERIIAQDAALTFLLLRYANSAMFHYRGAIKTLFQALQLLGLKRAGSLALTMLLANHGPACMLLLSRALTRASMCERLAVEHGGDGDAAFFVGILSMMGELLGQSLHELLHELRLSPEIEAALAERSGPLGQLLASVETFEAARMVGWPPQRVEQFNRTWLQSQVWSTQVLAMIGQDEAANAAPPAAV